MYSCTITVPDRGAGGGGGGGAWGHMTPPPPEEAVGVLKNRALYDIASIR